ncbi:head GIN domain-containing protein [Roseateles toxinivorans]|uniref:Putative autotransporter adhesin-like protein n=1 Tax=Roseateles toxinivorans TaxID=270368 RepID=A0A4R6QGZ9_9BURK|nr:head GIN domain-containing protein [Roseateles toxinivorans]TDP62238.1 putative autotransporter adhesin-like protein [Roseateles toxinivorans]
MLTRRLALCAALIPLFASTTASAWGNETVRGSGNVVTQTRAITGFDAISTRGGIDVLVRQSGKESVEVQTDDNLQSVLETQVVSGAKGRTLEISFKKGYSVSNHSKTLVTVDVIQLRALSIAGSGDVRAESINSPQLNLAIAGAGDMRLGKLSCDEIKISVAGSGDVVASGKTQKLSISIAGSGDVKTEGLAADDVSVSIAGSGDAVVAAKQNLTVKVAGSGDVKYVGNPANIKSSIMGSGSVNKL